MFVWALDRQGEADRQTWVDSLTLPLPGEPADVADNDFDDSYQQIQK